MRINEYWDSTIGEISLYINSYKDTYENDQKLVVYTNYNLAYMIAYFVANGLNGKQIPAFKELYPNISMDEGDDTEREKKRMAMMRDNWIIYAKEHNKRRHNKLEVE